MAAKKRKEKMVQVKGRHFFRLLRHDTFLWANIFYEWLMGYCCLAAPPVKTSGKTNRAENAREMLSAFDDSDDEQQSGACASMAGRVLR